MPDVVVALGSDASAVGLLWSTTSDGSTLAIVKRNHSVPLQSAAFTLELVYSHDDDDNKDTITSFAVSPLGLGAYLSHDTISPMIRIRDTALGSPNKTVISELQRCTFVVSGSGSLLPPLSNVPCSLFRGIIEAQSLKSVNVRTTPLWSSLKMLSCVCFVFVQLSIASCFFGQRSGSTPPSQAEVRSSAYLVVIPIPNECHISSWLMPVFWPPVYDGSTAPRHNFQFANEAMVMFGSSSDLRTPGEGRVRVSHFSLRFLLKKQLICILPSDALSSSCWLYV
jgi:hypothetical protein